jgi:SNF family Na+-dependent transporter
LVITFLYRVSGAGKVAYFTALFPYVVLFILLIGGATLEGAGKGLKYFLYQDFKKIASGKVSQIKQLFEINNQ